MKRNISILFLPFALLLTFSLAFSSTTGIAVAQEQTVQTVVSTKTTSVKVKCAKIRLRDNNAVGWVYGYGVNKKAAVKNANDKMPRGYKAKHCRVVAGGGSFSGGGGSFSGGGFRGGGGSF